MKKITSAARVGGIQPEITIVLGALQPGIPDAYYGMVHNAIMNEQAPKPVKGAEDEPDATLPKLKQAKDIPPFTPTVQQRAQCFIDTIDRQYPLLPGEYMLSERLTQLTKAMQGISAGTIVLERNTNMATLYYMVTNVTVDAEGQITVKKKELKPVTAADASKRMLLAAKKVSLPMKIAKGLGSSLVSKIGGFIGELILEQIFPSGGVPDYFDDVYKELTRIVSQKIDTNTITTINGGINNLVDKLDTEYGPAKKQADINTKEGRQILFDLLQKYDNLFLTGPSGMLGTLQDKSLAHAGYSVFMLGASLQLALLQEMARVDPNNYDKKDQKWRSPLESSYGLPENGTVAKTAKKYAEYAAQTWPDMLNKRRSQVGWQKYTEQRATGSHPKIGTIYSTFYMARLTDMGAATSITREIGQDDKDGKNPNYDAFVRDAAPVYKEQKVKEMIEDMGDPNPTIADWRMLVKTPVKVG